MSGSAACRNGERYCTHTRINVRMHARTHARAHTRTRTNKCAHPHGRMREQASVRVQEKNEHVRARESMRTHVGAHTWRVHACPCVHAQPRSYMRHNEARKCYRGSCKHVHKHVYKHMHRHAQTGAGNLSQRRSLRMLTILYPCGLTFLYPCSRAVDMRSATPVSTIVLR